MTRVAVVVFITVLATGCGRPPDDRNPEACTQYESCGICAAQPQCGWCMSDGAGVCVPNLGEGEPATAPDSCGDWRYRIADDPALPEGAPYCPEEVDDSEPQTAGSASEDDGTEDHGAEQ